MNRYTCLFSIILLAASSLAHGSDEGAGPETAPQVLASLAGDYALTSTFWPSPDAAPVVSHLPARRELALGGRVLRLDVGPNEDGFLGTGLMGFDAATGRYWYIWSDTSTTGHARLEGALDGNGTGELEGNHPTPGGSRPLRVEIRREGATEVHEYFDPSSGEELRWLELRYQPLKP